MSDGGGGLPWARVAAKSMSAYSVGGSWGPDSDGAGDPTAARQTGRDRLNVECELGGRLSSAYVRSSSRWSRVTTPKRKKKKTGEGNGRWAKEKDGSERSKAK